MGRAEGIKMIFAIARRMPGLNEFALAYPASLVSETTYLDSGGVKGLRTAKMGIIHGYWLDFEN